MFKKEIHKIRLMPSGQFFHAPRGRVLLEALFEAGIFLRTDCGGKGRCGKCMLKIITADHSEISPPDRTEQEVLGKRLVDSGYRLACRLRVCCDLVIEIPENSLQSPDIVRKGTVAPFLRPPFPVSEYPPRGIDTYALAVDLGTTTIALYLCDLVSRAVVASISVKNPQAIYGDDVMSRISAIAGNHNTLARLQALAVRAVEWGAVSLCRSTNIDPEKLKKMVIVGNSVMIHLFAGEDPSSIGICPHKPLFVEEKTFSAEEIGFDLSPSIKIQTLPLISGFLGSDIVAAGIATEIENSPKGTMLVDLGTNGEILLSAKDGFWATSCATGPAFEGATISHGMHAVSGAIDGVRIDRRTGEIVCSVLQYDLDKPKKPSGICGSGAVSAVAELLRTGVILENGRFNPDIHFPNLRYSDSGVFEFELISGENSQTGRPITLTQRDIRLIQLAKGALRSGIELVCRETGIEQPEKLLVAGAFGSFVIKGDALTIGMFPGLFEENIEVVGNAAGAGAILSLFDRGFLSRAKKLIHAIKVLDLSSHPAFQETFISFLPFSK
jgi:uncharacterized 2Fe-2S/4Fe-4S cluster protein (DUF4445 family)